MNPGAFLGAAIGAVLGAAVWAVVGAFTGYEVGYIAWGIGVAVGYGARLGGGSGKPLAITCALLALVSIFAGKVAAIQYAVDHELVPLVEAELTRELYDELVADAADFAALVSEGDYPAFMVSHGYAEETQVEDIPPTEFDYFRSFWIPTLREIPEQSYEEWRPQHAQRALDATKADMPIMQMALKELGLFDLIFAVLGLATAYRIALGAGADQSEPEEESPAV